MESIDVAAREYAVHMVGSDSYEQNDLEESFKAGVEFAQDWISSEDESPKKGDRVLLKDKDGEIECLLIYNEDYVTVLMELFTHWRYLDFLI